MLILGLLCFMYYLAFAQTPTNDSHWQLKWQDNFDTFNTNIWVKADSVAREHAKEPQIYIGNQVWTSGGNLVIEWNNTPFICPTPPPDPHWICDTCVAGKKYNYRSGLIETKPFYNTQFGYIEARIKLPFKRVGTKSWGFFPAFWTMCNIGSSCTTAGEIDIIEMFGGEYKEPNTLNTCIHRCYGDGCNNGNMSISHTYSDFDYTLWHTYAIEWNAMRIIWYLDGKVIRTTTNHQIVDPIRIILNFAIQSEKKYLPPTSPNYSAQMLVDYVKVYCLKCDKNAVVTKITDFNNYNYAVKKSISLDNQTTIPANSNITLRATDFIELKPGFEVQTGRELYLDVTPCETCVPIMEAAIILDGVE